MKLPRNPKFCKDGAWDTPPRGVYIPKWRKIFSFGAHAHPCTDGVKLNVEEWTEAYTPNFTPNHAMSRPCRANNLKINPLRNQIRGVCLACMP